MKQNLQKKEELNSYNKSVLEVPKDRSPERQASVEKIKPNLLPFKGDTK